MTGMYVRVEREGRWENFELEDLSEAELRTFFASKTDPAELRDWCVAIVLWIAANVKEKDDANGTG